MQPAHLDCRKLSPKPFLPFCRNHPTRLRQAAKGKFDKTLQKSVDNFGKWLYTLFSDVQRH
jgi:hypothetical protein